MGFLLVLVFLVPARIDPLTVRFLAGYWASNLFRKQGSEGRRTTTTTATRPYELLTIFLFRSDELCRDPIPFKAAAVATGSDSISLFFFFFFSSSVQQFE